MVKVCLFILAFCLVLFVSPALGQMSGTNFDLSAGALVGGGGTSASDSCILTGSVPLSASGVSSSSNYIASGGIIATIGEPYAFNLFYADSSELKVLGGTDHAFQIDFSGGRNVGDTIGLIYYRPGGQASFTTDTLNRNTGDTTFTYNLSGSLLGVRGLEYYLNVKVGSDSLLIGEPNAPYLFICSLSNTLGQRPTTTSAMQYRIVGVPVSIADDSSSVTSVFGDDLGAVNPIHWRLGSYNSTTDSVIEYPDADSVKSGRGYWLITRAAKTYGSPGNSIAPDTTYDGNRYYRLTLNSGWNQLANPLPFAVDWDSVLFDTNGTWVDRNLITVMEDSAYYYDGSGYTTVSTIPAWEGVFVKMNIDSVRAWFRYQESTAPPKKPSKKQKVTDEYWAVNLKLEKNGLVDDGNYAGVRKDASFGVDAYDFSEPPPPPNGPRLAFRLPDGSKGLKRSDFRPPFKDGATWDIDFAGSSSAVFTIGNLEELPEGMDAWLKIGGGTMMKLSADKPIILPNNVKSAQLIICTKEYTNEQEPDLLPLTYELKQNYPNPFNPVTNISFSLPEAGRTQLDIFNILGQKVKTLVNKEMPAGRYNVVWNSDNDAGDLVASGIYFYRISHGSFSEHRKMILLK